MALRQREYSPPSNKPLASSTIQSTINAVASTFRENGYGNPTKDEDFETGFLLSRQYRGFKNDDPKKEQQKALPHCVLLAMSLNQTTETRKAIVQLAIAGFFFACRSCEYLQVPKSQQRRTKLLTIGNISFQKEGIIIPHSSPLLPYSDCVSVTFELQKNDSKCETITQWKTNQPTMCPVAAWAAIVQRIRAYPNSSDKSKVCTVREHGRNSAITGKMMINALQDGIVAVGETKLGIKKEQIGTHSIRSGAAMAMYLGGCPIYSIMLIGRWRSTAFLDYIRTQVAEFSNDVSNRMLSTQIFQHVPDLTNTSEQSPPSPNIINGGSSTLMLY